MMYLTDLIFICIPFYNKIQLYKPTAIITSRLPSNPSFVCTVYFTKMAWKCLKYFHTHTSISFFPTVNESRQKALCNTMHSLAIRRYHVTIAVSLSTCEWVTFLFLLNPIRFKCANYGASEVCILARMCVNTPLTHCAHFTHTWFNNNLTTEKLFCVLT